MHQGSSMHIVCPHCTTSYAIKLASLGANGRTVRCSRCKETWVAHAEEVVEHTLYSKTSSWYFGSNVPGKPRRFGVYVGGFSNYRQRCDAVADEGYTGFLIRPSDATP